MTTATRRDPRRFLPFLLAAALVGLATVLRRGLDPVFGDQFPFITLFAAIAATAWWGGMGPGWLALALGALCDVLFIQRPRGALRIEGLDQQAGFAVFLVGGATIVLLGGSVHRARRLVERALRDESERREWLRVTLQSVGDGLIATDARGRVASLNPVAEQLTGWSSAEASGRPLAEVFRIVREGTDEPVEDPVATVLRDGVAVGLGNHTVLIARDGTRRPIDDSAAPIFDGAGTVCGVVLVFRDDTERRRADRALRDGQERLELAQEAARMGIWEWDIPTGRVTWSPGLEAMHGLAPGTFAGTFEAFQRAMHPDDREHVLRTIGEAVDQGREHRLEYRFIRADGEQRWAEGRGKLFRDGDGRPARLIGVCIDVTERKRAEEGIREQARVKESLRRIGGRLAAELDLQTLVQVVTDEATRLAGARFGAFFYNVRDERGEAFSLYTISGAPREAFSGFPMPRNTPVFEPTFRGEGAVRLDDVTRDPRYGRNPPLRGMPEGHLPVRSYLAAPVVSRSGEVLGGLFFGHEQAGVFTEEAEHLVVGVAAQAAIALDNARLYREARQSERRFRQLADAMPQIVWAARPDGYLDYYNRRWYEFTGVPEGEGGDESWKPILHPDDLQACLDRWYEAVRTAEPYEIEYRFRDRRHGGYRWFLGRALPVRDESGRVVRWFGTCTDIDDRKRAEIALRFLADASAALVASVDEHSLLRATAELAVPTLADFCIFDVLTDDGRLERLGWKHADPHSAACLDEVGRFVPTAAAEGHPVATALRTGQAVLIPDVGDDFLRAVAAGPEHLELVRGLGIRSLMTVPLRAGDRAIGALTFGDTAASGRRHDASDVRLAEEFARRAVLAIENARLYERLREADRRKDEFLATLAHELRNPLAPIRNALHLMGGAAGDAREFDDERAMAERQVVHLARLVDDLLDVARITRGKIDLRKEPLLLSSVVEKAVESLRHTIEERRHRLTVSLPPRPVRLEADPTRLEQVLWNLLSNAAKYTEPGGEIGLSAELEGDELVIRVRDTGIGIAPEMLPRVFEMFVQVDGQGGYSQGGLGIGLSLVKSLVEMHGGRLEARSEGPGRGSEFSARLPVLAAGAAEPTGTGPRDDAAARRDPGPAPPRRRVLVVDDNVDAARSLAKVLAALYGQEVRVAHDGPSALEAAGEFSPEVVLLDIGMPAMDGFEVAGRLRQRPEFDATLLVALTGWGQESDRLRSRQAGFDRHLVKPVDPDDLHRLLSDVGRQ